jgi:hypothetical protein
MMESLAGLPAFAEPLFFGILGAIATFIGSILRSGLTPTPRRIGCCFCYLGLVLMTIGLFCITSSKQVLFG